MAAAGATTAAIPLQSIRDGARTLVAAHAIANRVTAVSISAVVALAGGRGVKVRSCSLAAGKFQKGAVSAKKEPFWRGKSGECRVKQVTSDSRCEVMTATGTFTSMEPAMTCPDRLPCPL
jgi:hypothetical protein